MLESCKYHGEFPRQRFIPRTNTSSLQHAHRSGQQCVFHGVLSTDSDQGEYIMIIHVAP